MATSSTLRSEVQALLGMSLVIWGNLAKHGDPEQAVSAWELLLRSQKLRPGELTEALEIWATGPSAAYPPRPGDLLSIIHRERIEAPHRREIAAWRAAGRPTFSRDRQLIFLDPVPDGPESDRLALPWGLERDSRIAPEAPQRSNEALESPRRAIGATDG